MMIRIFLLIITPFLLAPTFAQNLQHTAYFEKDDSVQKAKILFEANTSHSNLKSSITGSYKKQYKELFDERFTVVTDLFTNNNVIVQPFVQHYFSQLLNNIIAKNNAYNFSTIRLLCSRYSECNAFCVGEGTLCVNAGLITQLNNEAQMAFVICHELAHHYFNHSNLSIAKYIGTINSKEVQESLQKINNQQYKANAALNELKKDLVFSGRRHSRSNENAADSLGLIFFVNAGYSAKNAVDVLNILDSIDEQTPLCQPNNIQQLFNLPNFAFNEEWIAQEKTSIFSKVSKNNNLTNQEKDSLKTHPDCQKRIANLTTNKRFDFSSQHNNYQIDSNSFNGLKRNLRLEVVEHLFTTNNLSKHLQYALYLYNNYPQHKPYATYCIARCLQTMYQYQKDHKLGKYIDVENRWENANYNVLLRFISNISFDDLGLLANAFVNYHTPNMKAYKEWNIISKNIIKQ